MTSDFADTIKAQVTQTILAALLERGGYRVTRLGIEELIGEIKFLQRDRYRDLDLPMQLRLLPDLLVASLELREAILIEVKFRRCFDERAAQGLFKELEGQRQFWPQAYAVLMISEPLGKPARFHQDYIRVLPPHQTGRLIDDRLDLRERWRSMPGLQMIFRRFAESKPHRSMADFVALALKSLGRL